jgi:hypothetical protein
MKELRSQHPLCIPTYLMVHGLFLLFLEPAVGWIVWGLLVLAATAVHAASDWLREKLGVRMIRALAAVYAVVVGLPAVGHWLFVPFHSPILWIAITLAVGWLAWLLWRKWNIVAAIMTAALLAPAVLLPAMASGGTAALPVMGAVAAIGVVILLTAAFAGGVRKLGAIYWLLFALLFCSMAANDVFYHGMDQSAEEGAAKPGVTTILLWKTPPSPYLDTFGTDLRFLAREPYGRLLIGSAKGVFLVSPKEIRPLPVGPAGDNVAVGEQQRRVYAPTRDGRLSLLAGEGLGLAHSVPLPHGALVARFAPEGVYALDEWRHVGRYDPDTLAQQKTWPTMPVSDLAPDNLGGFFLTTLTGRLEHHRFGMDTQTAALPMLGVFHLLALDQDGRRLFVSNMGLRRLQVFDAHDLHLLKEVEVDRGCRNLWWDAQKSMLLYGSYFVGDLVALDGETLREIGRLHLGRRMRTLLPDGPGRVLVASGGGLFAVELAAAFGAGSQ